MKEKTTLALFVIFAVSILQLGCKQSTSASSDYERTSQGLIIHPGGGQAKEIKLIVMNDRIIRVVESANKSPLLPSSIMVVAKPQDTPFTVEESAGSVQLKTDKVTADVSLDSGRVSFFNSAGEPVLASVDSGQFSKVTKDPGAVDADSYALRQIWQRDSDEALYGLGQQQNGQVNLANQNVYMTTYNLIITIPYLISSKNYGILWDNNSDSHYGKPESASPLFEQLKLFDAEGKEGGLTARYYDGDKLLLERVEKDLNYQFLENYNTREIPFPDAVKDAKNLRIVWEGSVSSDQSGAHEFLMYSSGHASLSIDGKELLNRWRMNWNPWYHNVRVNMTAGNKESIKVEWTPQGGYFHLMHHNPFTGDEQHQTSIASDTGKAIDYYFVLGDNADQLIGGYRKLTGKSVMLPRWAYGFWQSRERYKTQDELVAVLKEYRDRKIPIDNIVLDWSYWPVDAWGSHDFDPKFFPDPKKMVDEVHDLHGHIMISVWPKFYPTTENYKELDAKGYMFHGNTDAGNLDWIAPGYLNDFYDTYNPDARKMYWHQIDQKLNVLGFDAWWLDDDEPDIISNISWTKRKAFMTPNHLGTGAEVFNAYAVPHTEGVYQGDRAASPDTRVFILSRSGFGGIQRNASAIWSGDTVSRWSNMKEQIAAGIGTGLAGMPNWTFDIGGFTPEDKFRMNVKKGDAFVGSYADMDPDLLPDWQELMTRWFEFGAFVPLYRSHGQNPYREIYNICAEGSECYKALVWYTKMRYRLLPYIYSQAGDMYHKDSTLMRGLVMDFPNDSTARNVNDEYMFGPAFLVAPVYQKGATTRSVYLPSGSDWIDFYSGDRFTGGQTVEAAAPLSRMPLFVRAGAVLISGPELQYSDQLENADLTVSVFTGTDGSFELYEDDGHSYAYEKGEWSRIPFSYNEATSTLTIGARNGSFAGMEQKRRIKVRWIDGDTFSPADLDAGIATTIDYDGSAVEVHKH